MKDISMLTNNGIEVDASLELFGDIEIYNEALEGYLDTITEKVNNLNHYKEVGDMPNYAIIVHGLKSDSKYLGFMKLAEMAFSHEMESKANNMNFVYNNYDALIKEVNQVTSLVSAYLGKDEGGQVVEVKPQVTRDKKILVVDDSNLIRNLIQKMFDNEFEVLTAEDGREALEKIEEEPNLYGVLLDLNMPNVNGFEVLEYFKQNNLFVKIPVAIITGDDTKETVEKAFTYTIVDVLNKPFNERDVKRVLTAMINFH
ncbi:MAG: response regulator [Bacilli bacterium]|nr:response regulator [Bacilli bacterium]